jgi:hypothetical protein
MQVEDALAELGQPPEFLVQAVKVVISDPANRAYLKERGRVLARFAVGKLPSLVKKRVEAPSPPNPWVQGVVSPVLDPLTEGFSQEASTLLRPYFWGVGALFFGVGALGFVLGRVTKR